MFSGAQPKLELLRRLSSSAQAGVDGTPALESTVACVPITGVAEVAAQLVSSPSSNRWFVCRRIDTLDLRPPVLKTTTQLTHQTLTPVGGRFCQPQTKRVAGCAEGATGKAAWLLGHHRR